MILVGLSGGISTGKSTVAEIFKELGCHIIDADLIARKVVEPFKPAWKEIIQHFGEEVLQENGELDREKLGNIIFANEHKRRLLNKITHARIFRHMVLEILSAALTGERILVLDLPLLFEKNYHNSWLISKTVVVSCDKDQQINRLVKRNNLKEDKALDRINSQMSLAKKCKLSDLIIDNSKDINTTRNQVIKIYDTLNSSTVIWRNRFLLYFFISLCIGLLVYLFHFIISKLVL